MANSEIKTQNELPIPQPPPHFLVGNLNEISAENRLASLTRLFKLYGPIYKLSMGGKTFIYLGSHELVDEICDDDRFEKFVSGPLYEVRNMAGKGQISDKLALGWS
jgi:cytochrome P450/NADPH-cytochrome P450 reductase